MLHRARHLKNYQLRTLDGDIGSVKDWYFHDEEWHIRYLVADTGTWLPGRQVLVSPLAIMRVNDAEETIVVNLSKRQLEDAPSIDTDVPVSRHYEEKYYQYYGWPRYWYGPEPWRTGVDSAADRKDSGESPADPHLESAKDLMGYYIEARAGSIGHVDDFILDDQDWVIRYLVVDTVNWWPGKKVLVPPQWVTSISWQERKFHVDLDRETIKQAPAFDDTMDVTRAYEEELFRHYGRHEYWAGAIAAGGGHAP